MNSSSSTATTTSNGRSPDTISRRAYEIWEREGRPEGNDLKHWLQAEQELGNDSNGAADTAQDQTRNANTDTSPLQGTRAAQAASRPPKRQSGAPFSTDKNGSTSASNSAATKRKA